MTTNIITTILVPESQRLDTVDEFFGIRFPLTVEPTIYQFATQLAPAYSGGYWQFFRLSNSGFYMAPRLDSTFGVIADNGYEGTMSADALGVTACLYTFSNLSFSGGTFGDTCAEQFHRLREFALEHIETRAILAAMD